MGKTNAKQKINPTGVDFEICIGFSLTRKSANVILQQIAFNSDRITNSNYLRRK
jgi:hypothetical protein